MAKKTHDEELTLAELTKRVAKARALLSEVRALFPEAHGLSQGDRQRSQGRMGLAESKALRAVIDAVEASPAKFADLADEDAGHDPGKVETPLLYDRFDRHDLYRQLSDEIDELTVLFSDQALQLGQLAKPFAQAAYEIAKPLSKRNATIREKIAPTLDYYGANAAAAAASRAANKAADAKESK